MGIKERIKTRYSGDAAKYKIIRDATALGGTIGGVGSIAYLYNDNINLNKMIKEKDEEIKKKDNIIKEYERINDSIKPSNFDRFKSFFLGLPEKMRNSISSYNGYGKKRSKIIKKRRKNKKSSNKKQRRRSRKLKKHMPVMSNIPTLESVIV